MARMRYGTHALLEAEANRLIKESLAGETRHSAKSDLLTPWKEADRKSREVYVPSGTPDPANRSGIFHRRINTQKPYLNSRDGMRIPTHRDVAGSLRSFVDEHGAPPKEDID